MFAWSELLDSMVAGTRERPAHSQVMRLPPIDGWERGRIWCEFEVDPDLIQPQGNLFGGYISALADEFLGIAAMTVVPDHAPYSNSDIHVNFFRPIKGGRLKIEARVVHQGRRNLHTEVEFWNQDEELAAKGNATYVVSRTRIVAEAEQP